MLWLTSAIQTSRLRLNIIGITSQIAARPHGATGWSSLDTDVGNNLWSALSAGLVSVVLFGEELSRVICVCCTPFVEVYHPRIFTPSMDKRISSCGAFQQSRRGRAHQSEQNQRIAPQNPWDEVH